MTKIVDDIRKEIFEAVKMAYPEVEIQPEDIELEHPGVEEHGDYATNITKKLHLDPEKIIEKIDLAGVTPANVNGFINFTLDREFFINQMQRALEEGECYGQNLSLKEKKMMVEYAHPNTHKELHIGHMRTLITGEALVRILEACGATVFRANYQGDVGPHVAKAIWGTEKILKEQKQSWEEAEKLSLGEKAHLLGEGYVRGNKEYEENQGDKEEMDELNNKLYVKDVTIWSVYERTKKWSLDYYDSFYSRFYTKFDELYFESGVADDGKKIVMENLGKVFEKSEGAMVFLGEKYGLHTRVFVTANGNPTYEGKEMGLGPRQFADFPFDKCIHVVANEQAGYFAVVIKALELIDPKFVGKEFHLSMGMVNLVGKKISSRTGVLVTVDGVLDDVKSLLKKLASDEKSLEATTIGAVKYSVLKTAPTMNSTFDLEKSVSLEGDSGPYLQYTYARAKSVLRKAGTIPKKGLSLKGESLMSEELTILRYLYRFPEVVEAASRAYSPNLICSYLFELAKRFNGFYNTCPILQPVIARNEETKQSDSGQARMTNRLPRFARNDTTGFRLELTAAVSVVLRNGLKLLGIEALEKM